MNKPTLSEGLNIDYFATSGIDEMTKVVVYNAYKTGAKQKQWKDLSLKLNLGIESMRYLDTKFKQKLSRDFSDAINLRYIHNHLRDFFTNPSNHSYFEKLDKSYCDKHSCFQELDKPFRDKPTLQEGLNIDYFVASDIDSLAKVILYNLYKTGTKRKQWNNLSSKLNVSPERARQLYNKLRNRLMKDFSDAIDLRCVEKYLLNFFINPINHSYFEELEKNYLGKESKHWVGSEYNSHLIQPIFVELSPINIHITRCYLNVSGEIYYCVASILKNQECMSVRIESDFMLDDGIDQNISFYMRNIIYDLEKCRLFYDGVFTSPCLIDKEFIYKGAVFTLH